MDPYHNYLHHQALKIAEQFRKTESELLDILQKIEKRRVYRDLGYASLFIYATEALKLSEAVAYSFIQVARKAKEVPELKAAIAQGEITISKAQRIVSVITPENKSEILIMAKTLPKQQLEKQVARLNPQQIVPEKIRYVTEERLEFKLGVSEALIQQIRRVQDLLSSQQRRAVSLEETLSSMTREYLDRHDPIEKAKRSQARQASNDHTHNAILCPGRVDEKFDKPGKQLGEKETLPAIDELGEFLSLNQENKTGHDKQQSTIPALSKHTVMLRDQGQCTFVDKQGRRCQEGRWLHVHHLEQQAYGGSHEPKNLQLLCSGHHRAVHSCD